VSEIIFPRSFVVLVVLMIMGFVWSCFGEIKLKSKESKQYRKLADSTTATDTLQEAYNSSANNAMPYQLGANQNYAFPTADKDVTYCVIDGRLVDS